MDEKGLVFNIMGYSISDGPGIRTTVFLQGCPLNCSWCHNPEGQSPRPQLIYRRERCLECGACLEVCPADLDPAACRLCGRCAEICPAGARELLGREYTVAQVLAEIEKDRIFYEESGGGVTFSGGEPLFQPDFLLALLMACRERGLHTALDTTGFAPYPVLAALAPYTDLFLYDLKLMDSDRHLAYTGVANGIILSNLARLSQVHPGVALRLPLIPGITDTTENLEAMAAFIKPLPLLGIEILPYHNTAQAKYQLLGRSYPPDLVSPAPARTEEAAIILAASGHPVKIGGVTSE